MVGPGKLNVELLQNFKFCYVVITDLRICRFQVKSSQNFILDP